MGNRMSKFQEGDLVEVIEPSRLSIPDLLGERATVLCVAATYCELDISPDQVRHRDPKGFFVRGSHGGLLFHQRALRKIDDDDDGRQAGSWDEVPWRPARLGFLVDEQA